jgi:hypothetical protein
VTAVGQVKFHDNAALKYHDLPFTMPIPLNELEATRQPTKNWQRVRLPTPMRANQLARLFDDPGTERTKVRHMLEPILEEEEAGCPDLVPDDAPETPTTVILDPTEFVFSGCDVVSDQIADFDAKAPLRHANRVVGHLSTEDTGPTIQVLLEHVAGTALIDTGAMVSLISEAFWLRLDSPRLTLPKYGLVTANNEPIETRAAPVPYFRRAYP